MSNDDGRRNWSLINLEKFQEYTDEADRLVQMAIAAKIHPFSAALAGVSFIRQSLAAQGGVLAWWVDMIRDPVNTLASSAFLAPPQSSPGRGPDGKQ